MMAGSTESVLDLEILDELRALADDDDPDFLKDLVQTYLNELPSLLASLRQAVDDDDRDLARRTAHRLKGSSANIGACQLSEQCSALENAAADAGQALEELLGAVEALAGPTREQLAAIEAVG